MKSYTYKKQVLIGDTNLLQNMYFANFFKLQGEVRELFLKDCVDGSLKMLEEGLILITKNANMEYVKDFYLYDTIRVELTIPQIGSASCELNFSFYNDETNEVHAKGNQTIVFADKNHKITRIPPTFKNTLHNYNGAESAILS